MTTTPVKWTPAMDAKLRELYPRGGAAVAARVLGVTTRAAERRANRLRVRVEKVPAAEKFEAQVWRADGGCHVWTGKKSPDGYPLFRVGGGREVSAHRRAWEQKFGPVPAGKYVKHSCPCQVCVRPDHLYLSDSATSGESHGKLSAADVIDMRRRYMAKEVTVPELVDEFGLSKNHVYLILNGKAWPHVWPFNKESYPMSTLNGTHNRVSDAMSEPSDLIGVLSRFGPDDLAKIDDEITRLQETIADLTTKAESLAKWRAALAGVFQPGKAPAREEARETPAEVQTPKPRKENETKRRIAHFLATSGPQQFGVIAEVLCLSQSAVTENTRHPWFAKTEGNTRSPYRLTAAGEAAVREQYPSLEIKPQTAGSTA